MSISKSKNIVYTCEKRPKIRARKYHFIEQNKHTTRSKKVLRCVASATALYRRFYRLARECDENKQYRRIRIRTEGSYILSSQYVRGSKTSLNTASTQPAAKIKKSRLCRRLNRILTRLMAGGSADAVVCLPLLALRRNY